jgi:hypothetical protein
MSGPAARPFSSPGPHAFCSALASSPFSDSHSTKPWISRARPRCTSYKNGRRIWSGSLLGLPTMVALLAAGAVVLALTWSASAYFFPPKGAITVGGAHGQYDSISAALSDTSSDVYFIYPGYARVVLLSMYGPDTFTVTTRRRSTSTGRTSACTARLFFPRPTSATVRPLPLPLLLHLRSLSGHNLPEH